MFSHKPPPLLCLCIFSSLPPSLLPHSLISQPLHTNTSETNNFTLCICVVCNTRNKEVSPNTCLVFFKSLNEFLFNCFCIYYLQCVRRSQSLQGQKMIPPYRQLKQRLTVNGEKSILNELHYGAFS